MSDPKQNDKQAAKVKARVLVATTIEGKEYKPNDVITANAGTIKALDGTVDADPAAVKYAESLKRSAEKDAIED